MPQHLVRPTPDSTGRTDALLSLWDVLGPATEDLPTLLHTATEAVARLCGDTSVLWRVGEHEGRRYLQVAAGWHSDPAARADLLAFGGPVRLFEEDQGFLWHVATGDALLLESVQAEVIEGVHPRYRDYFARWGLTSMIVVPLRVRGALLGALGVTRDSDGPLYDSEDLLFVSRVGAQVALALDNAMLVDTARRELAERTAAEERMRHLAGHDPLTGLPNRMWLLSTLSAALDSGPTSLALLDLNGFKHVNDSLGHTHGDHVLVQVAQRLQQALGPEAELARLGGDEFAAVFAGTAGMRSAADAVQRLVEALRDPIELSGTRLPVTAAVGLAHREAPVSSPAEAAAAMLREADVAMYRAKDSGATHAAFDPVLDAEASSRLHRVAELRGALDRDELVLHYQPVVRSDDGTVHHVEALVRWQHPERGLVPPAGFVDLAEQAGLGYELAELVLAHALDQAARWRDGGAGVPVAVNVSATVLADERWAGAVRDALRARDLDPGLLTLEVVESAVASASAQAALRRLADVGVQISLDDFGTGWSSLLHLKRLPLHELKVDRAFVAGAHADPADRALIGAVVTLSRTLGLRMVAEGVEEQHTAELLRELGVDLQQGWLHGRPAPADD